MSTIKDCLKCGRFIEVVHCGECVNELEKDNARLMKEMGGMIADMRETDQENKKLKAQLACGGTSKNGVIELQGDHTHKIKGILEKLGFPQDSITIN